MLFVLVTLTKLSSRKPAEEVIRSQESQRLNDKYFYKSFISETMSVVVYNSHDIA